MTHGWLVLPKEKLLEGCEVSSSGGICIACRLKSSMNLVGNNKLPGFDLRTIERLASVFSCSRSRISVHLVPPTRWPMHVFTEVEQGRTHQFHVPHQ